MEGTDNVYIFRNGNHQSMFIVTKAGVIATDPIAYGRPTGGQTYVDEIKKVTNQPIKYLIYSHHHYDHIAGGKAFKDAGATVDRAQARQGAARSAEGSAYGAARRDRRQRGQDHHARRHHAGAQLFGLNHSDSTLVMRLPKEKLIFVVDLIPVGSVPGRGMIDFYPLESEELDQEDHRAWTGSG